MTCGVSTFAVSRAAFTALVFALALPAHANAQEVPSPPASAAASPAGAPGGSTGAGGPTAAPGGEPEFVYDRGPRPQDPEIRLAPPLGDDHPLVRPFVDANPGKDLVLCLAGCRREPGIVNAQVTTKGARPATVYEHLPQAAIAAPASTSADTTSATKKPASRLDCIAGC